MIPELAWLLDFLIRAINYGAVGQWGDPRVKALWDELEQRSLVRQGIKDSGSLAKLSPAKPPELARNHEPLGKIQIPSRFSKWEYQNRYGIPLGIIAQLDSELRELLEQLAHPDYPSRSGRDLALAAKLWHYQFDELSIAGILRDLKPCQKTQSQDYLEQIISKIKAAPRTDELNKLGLPDLNPKLGLGWNSDSIQDLIKLYLGWILERDWELPQDYKELAEFSKPAAICSFWYSKLLLDKFRLLDPSLWIALEPSSKLSKPKLDCYKLAWILCIYYCCVTDPGGMIYIWDGSRFIPGESKLARLISDSIWAGLGHRASPAKVRDVLDAIRNISKLGSYPFNRDGRLIPLKNGMLDPTSKKLYPHSPWMGFSYRINARYDPDAKSQQIDAFLDQVAGQNRKLIQMILGDCLRPGNKYQRGFMLLGSGGEGKSTLLKLIEALLGTENVSHVSLQELVSNRFAPAQLLGKLANIYADIPKQPLRYTGPFKIVTGGDTMIVERKFRDPFDAVLALKLIFSANELPEVNDLSYAFWRRWILIPFNQRIQNPDPNILEKLIGEQQLSYLLNLALQGLEQLESHGGYELSQDAQQLKDAWLRCANPVYGFVADHVVRDPGEFVTKADAYYWFELYCEKHELKPCDKREFGLKLQMLVPGIREGQRRFGSERRKTWEGIKLVNTELLEQE